MSLILGTTSGNSTYGPTLNPLDTSGFLVVHQEDLLQQLQPALLIVPLVQIPVVQSGVLQLFVVLSD